MFLEPRNVHTEKLVRTCSRGLSNLAFAMLAGLRCAVVLHSQKAVRHEKPPSAHRADLPDNSPRPSSAIP